MGFVGNEFWGWECTSQHQQLHKQNQLQQQLRQMNSKNLVPMALMGAKWHLVVAAAQFNLQC